MNHVWDTFKIIILLYCILKAFLRNIAHRGQVHSAIHSKVHRTFVSGLVEKMALISTFLFSNLPKRHALSRFMKYSAASSLQNRTSDPIKGCIQTFWQRICIKNAKYSILHCILLLASYICALKSFTCELLQRIYYLCNTISVCRLQIIVLINAGEATFTVT